MAPPGMVGSSEASCVPGDWRDVPGLPGGRAGGQGPGRGNSVLTPGAAGREGTVGRSPAEVLCCDRVSPQDPNTDVTCVASRGGKDRHRSVGLDPVGARFSPTHRQRDGMRCCDWLRMGLAGPLQPITCEQGGRPRREEAEAPIQNSGAHGGESIS